MKDLILKWWNRKWSNWEILETRESYKDGWCTSKYKYHIMISKSNDGLVRYKKIKVDSKFVDTKRLNLNPFDYDSR